LRDSVEKQRDECVRQIESQLKPLQEKAKLMWRPESGPWKQLKNHELGTAIWKYIQTFDVPRALPAWIVLFSTETSSVFSAELNSIKLAIVSDEFSGISWHKRSPRFRELPMAQTELLSVVDTLGSLLGSPITNPQSRVMNNLAFEDSLNPREHICSEGTICSSNELKPVCVTRWEHEHETVPILLEAIRSGETIAFME